MIVEIPTRFCGPPTSANGGYTCGLMAEQFDGTVEVSLRAPPPLDAGLDLRADGERWRLWDGDTLIAEARASELDLVPPPAPGFDTAKEASNSYAGFQQHDYPTCFACGPQRGQHDGLRVFAGHWQRGIVASPWIPDASLADERGRMPTPVLWAAIDCPGAWAIIDEGDSAERPVLLLGRMTAHFIDSVAAGDSCVVIGWPLGVEGRKHHAGTALFDGQGRCVGYSRQTWIAVKQ